MKIEQLYSTEVLLLIVTIIFSVIFVWFYIQNEKNQKEISNLKKKNSDSELEFNKLDKKLTASELELKDLKKRNIDNEQKLKSLKQKVENAKNALNCDC